jgi:hypothetical protein
VWGAWERQCRESSDRRVPWEAPSIAVALNNSAATEPSKANDQWRRLRGGVMKSALECFQHASKCEEKAKQAISDAGRSVLLETANHWRRLGRQAEAKETSGGRPAKVPRR